MVPVSVMTKGEAGALITADGRDYAIPPAKPERVADPTGAGDAFRAGLVLGMKRGFPWPVTGRVAALTAVYAVENPGTQAHSYTPREFVDRYAANFGPSDEVAALAQG
jgi:adenosine kinase